MKLYSINTGYFKLDGGAMFGVVPKSMWQKLNPPDENNMCSWAMRCLLIEDGDKLILVDNGMGNKQDEKFFGHYYLHGEDTLERSLSKNGFSKDDITDVFLTHLHFDHCGGSIERQGDKLVPAFKNATYWSNESHWHSATHPNKREKASFLKENIIPIEETGRLKFIEHPMAKEEGWVIYPDNTAKNIIINDMSALFVNGHTDSMMIPHINYKGKTIAFMADLIPSIFHIPEPYIMAYDMCAKRSLAEKTMFLNEALSNSYILFFEHDPNIECCNLQQTEKGIRSKDTFVVADI